MSDLELKVLEILNSGGTIAMVGTGAKEALERITVKSTIPREIWELSSVEDFNTFVECGGMVCTLPISLKPVGTRFSIFGTVVDGEIKSINISQFGSRLSFPLFDNPATYSIDKFREIPVGV